MLSAGSDRRIAGLLLALALSSCVHPQPDHLAAFEQTLAGNDSATAALTAWCAARGIAEPARIEALPGKGAARPASAAVRALLEVGAEEQLGYRHVRLACGGTVLSVAHNWFAPGRLTAAMNDTLATTTRPFGQVAAPLSYRRERLEAVRGAAAECPPDTVLSHRALLRSAEGRPISHVVECYTPANLH